MCILKVKECFGTAVYHSIVFRLKIQKSIALEKKMILIAFLTDLNYR